MDMYKGLYPVIGYISLFTTIALIEREGITQNKLEMYSNPRRGLPEPKQTSFRIGKRDYLCKRVLAKRIERQNKNL